ncbi:MAG: excinuclease ABC subunit UvrA [Polyangiales bacterium]
MEPIRVRGARVHNLKNVDLDLPRGALVVVTGPSGCGKSSLAFDTLFAEGRRRYIESLSVSARRALGGASRPDVDLIDGLSPAIAVAQGAVGRSPRSTVGTLTEVDDHLRLLLARVGEVSCPGCGAPVEARTPSEIVDETMALPEGTRVMILAPWKRAHTGDLTAALASLQRDGFVRVRLDGEVVGLDELPPLDTNRSHDVDVVVDRIAVRPGARARTLDAVELALRVGGGTVSVAVQGGETWVRTTRFACARCGRVMPDVTPSLFSFNSPAGQCPRCVGLGVERDTENGVKDPTRSLRGGAVPAWKKALPESLTRYAASLGVDLDAPWSELSARAREELLLGDGDLWPGIDALLRGGDDEDPAPTGRFDASRPCALCAGARLRPEALCVRVAGANLAELSREPLLELRARLRDLRTPKRHEEVAARVLHEVLARLDYLAHVGVGYLTLARAAPSLSTGEGQRVRLATQLGGGLSGVLYVLDEPCRGLHPTDRAQLRESLHALVRAGNSVVVVEHDLDTVRAAAHVVDMGPGAGPLGGEVLAQGTVAEVIASPRSVTGPWLSGARQLRRAPRAVGNGPALTLRDVRTHNLRGVTARFPLGALTAVTGVSGSGKSSLVLGALVPAIRAALAGTRGVTPSLDGASAVQRLVALDASPLGRSARSTPATLLGVLDPLRDLFAALPEAKARGYRAARFSYNARGGRCERCRGDGILRVAMEFLADVTLPCDACGGRRYEPETLAVTWRGMSIADVLDLTVDAALAQFEAHPKIRAPLRALHDVGVGYLRLAQPSSTLSGGEAQRVRLARELVRRTTAGTLYVLDEPTAGLHRSDVEAVMHLLGGLVDEGATVVIIEHDPAVIALADHVIDLGPGAGPEGGEVCWQGDVAGLRARGESRTAQALRAHLGA